VNVYDLIHSAGFVIPSVQWDPDAQEFPLNLSVESEKAKEFLAANRDVTKGTVSLLEIFLENYMPTEAVRANHLNFSENRHHWLVVFRFSAQEEELLKRFTVYVLLDGSILKAVEDGRANR
jgi:hypothetical protein